MASPAKENENKLSLMALSGTPTIFTVLQISMYMPNVHRGPHLVMHEISSPVSNESKNEDSLCCELGLTIIKGIHDIFTRSHYHA